MAEAHLHDYRENVAYAEFMLAAADEAFDRLQLRRSYGGAIAYNGRSATKSSKRTPPADRRVPPLSPSSGVDPNAFRWNQRDQLFKREFQYSPGEGRMKTAEVRTGGLVPGAKETVQKILEDLDDDVSLEEIQYHIYVRQKIERARRDVQEGRVVSQEEARKRLAKWTEQ